MVSELNQKILSELQIYDDDFVFLNKTMNNLRKRFANKYVVIKNKKVVGEGHTIHEAMDSAKEKGIEVDKAIVEFIPKKEEILIL